jgi:hypothetical protein
MSMVTVTISVTGRPCSTYTTRLAAHQVKTGACDTPVGVDGRRRGQMCIGVARNLRRLIEFPTLDHADAQPEIDQQSRRSLVRRNCLNSMA